MNKVIKTALVLTPVVTVVSGIGIYFGLSTAKDVSQKSSEIISQSNNPTNDTSGESDLNLTNDSPNKNPLGLQVFPNLNQALYYKYVRMNNGEPFISDDLIAHVINDVLLKMQYTDGEVSWGYSFVNNVKKDDVTISFVLKPTGQGILKDFVTRSYNFVLTKS